MVNNNIVYSNLRAEMARHNLGITDIAKKLGLTRETVSKKLSGKSKITLDEAMEIKKILFFDKNVEYLFKELEQKAENKIQ